MSDYERYTTPESGTVAEGEADRDRRRKKALLAGPGRVHREGRKRDAHHTPEDITGNTSLKEDLSSGG